MRVVTRYVLAVCIACGFCVIAVLSLPWMMASIGFGIMGDAATEDRLMHASPAWRFLEWRDAHEEA